MKKNTGLWIDHKEAILVSVEGEQTFVQRTESAAESHLKPTGGWKSGGTVVAQSVSNEHVADERQHQYHAFYQKVIGLLGDSESIALLGPVRQKSSLPKRLKVSASCAIKCRWLKFVTA